MDIVNANYGLVKRVLERYENVGLDKVEIYLTHHKYVKGQGNGNCFKLIDDLQVKLLEDLRIFQTEKILPNSNNPNIKLYKGSFFPLVAKDWYGTRILKIQPTWGWHDKNKNQYQFGKYIFKQRGKLIRGRVFQALMDLYEKSPGALSVKSLCEMTRLDPQRIRIEISAINKRLKKQIKLYFKGSGKGYYTLEKYS